MTSPYEPTEDERRVIKWLAHLPWSGRVSFSLKLRLAWLALTKPTRMVVAMGSVFAEYISRGEHLKGHHRHD